MKGHVLFADLEDGLWLWKRRVLCGFSNDLVGALLASTGRAASTGPLALAQTRPGKVDIRLIFNTLSPGNEHETQNSSRFRACRWMAREM